MSTRQRIWPCSHSWHLGILLLVVSIITTGTPGITQDKPLTIRQARVCITGADHNRPDPFPGIGDFIGWPGGIDRLPNGDLLLAHSAGYWHSSFAQPRLIEPELRKRWTRMAGRLILPHRPADAQWHAGLPTTATPGQNHSPFMTIAWMMVPMPFLPVVTEPFSVSLACKPPGTVLQKPPSNSGKIFLDLIPSNMCFVPPIVEKPGQNQFG